LTKEHKIFPYTIRIFPYKEKNGEVVEWNAVISETDDDGDLQFVCVTTSLCSKELALMNAENIVKTGNPRRYK
jgi:hypothetical protein